MNSSNLVLLPFMHGVRLACTLGIVLTVSACSGSNSSSADTDSQGAQSSVVELNNSVNSNNNSVGEGNTTLGNTASEFADASGTVTPNTGVPSDVRVNFEIVLPAYQSNELLVEVNWGDISLTANWVNDELWNATGDFPRETEHLLSVTFYDRYGEIELARFSQNFETDSNATETYAISADQFDTSLFDDDEDGVSNFDELVSGTNPSIDEDAQLEIRDSFFLSSISTSRMSVSTSFEGALSDDRPYYDFFERLPEPGGYPGTQTAVIDIDASGNGTRTYYETLQGSIRELNGTRTNNGDSITWVGTRYAYDGDYGHRVSFTNTVAIVDETTRSFVEELEGSNGGTYQFGWNVNANLIGRLVDGTSLCQPVSGTVSRVYRENYWGSEGTTTTATSVSKEIDDLYWRVVNHVGDNEATEYFARELIIYRPNISASTELAPKYKYFICDFVEF